MIHPTNNIPPQKVAYPAAGFNPALAPQLQNLKMEIDAFSQLLNAGNEDAEGSGEVDDFGLGGGLDSLYDPATERFRSSATGGVIVGANGAPAGTVPPGSFVDTTDGSVYGPDGRQISIPSGASVDFFDLPDVNALVSGGGATSAPQKTTPQKAAYPASTQPASSVAGASGSGATAPAKAALVSGGGAVANQDFTNLIASATQITQQLAQVIAQAQALNNQPRVEAPAGTGVAGTSGGGVAAAGTAAAGAQAIGTEPTLASSLADLVSVIRELAEAIKTLPAIQASDESTVEGGGSKDAPAKKDSGTTVGGASGAPVKQADEPAAPSSSAPSSNLPPEPGSASS